MKKFYKLNFKLLITLLLVSNFSVAQTNVFDDVIATSPNHTYLETALLQEGLDAALRQNTNCTVFAPDDSAFNKLATALNTTISGLLALTNLSDILTYHVLGSTILSTGISNGATIQNPNDIEKMCVKMEHSYLGDLEMKLTCPSGQSVNIFNSSTTAGGLFPGGFGGGNDFLCGAFDDNTGNVGDCEQYCFSNLNNAMPSIC